MGTGKKAAQVPDFENDLARPDEKHVLDSPSLPGSPSSAVISEAGLAGHLDRPACGNHCKSFLRSTHGRLPVRSTRTAHGQRRAALGRCFSVQKKNPRK